MHSVKAEPIFFIYTLNDDNNQQMSIFASPEKRFINLMYY